MKERHILFIVSVILFCLSMYFAINGHLRLSLFLYICGVYYIIVAFKSKSNTTLLQILKSRN